MKQEVGNKRDKNKSLHFEYWNFRTFNIQEKLIHSTGFCESIFYSLLPFAEQLTVADSLYMTNKPKHEGGAVVKILRSRS